MTRYIDAEKFKRMYREQLNCVFLALQKSFGEAIDDVPTADVRENVYGEWINDKNESVKMIDGVPQETCWCSNCKEWLTASDEYECYGNYCPKCGADMRKGEAK